MSEWDGRGLPPAAAARMRRFDAGSAWTSLLSVPGMTAVSGVGLRPVGEVMGCIVEHIGWQGFGGCGYWGSAGRWAPNAGATVTSGQGARYAGYAPYVNALHRGYDTAIARMVTEAQAVGADGVVGVRLSVNHLGQDNREFVALGTAVRGNGRTHPPRPFVTDLAGADVAKLLQAGWVPVSMAFGIAVAVRHDDYATQSQARGWGTNTEVSGYTELVQYVRADARDRFGRHAARSGADGAIVSSLDLHVWAREPGEGHRDHIAESTVFGTAIARFHRGRVAPTRTLTVLPLRRS